MTALRRTQEDITSIADDKRIESVDEIISPRQLIDKYPLDIATASFIELNRKIISNIIN